jgi:hypothetical protein
MPPHPDICPLGPVSGSLGAVTVVCMIDNPHTLHTHSRSTLYIYKVLQFLHIKIVAKGHKEATPNVNVSPIVYQHG